MIWHKFFPWKFIVRRIMHRQGLVDPIWLWAIYNRLGQPSEVKVPGELLRAGYALHVRGLFNSRIIQHNLDWIWPYWVVRQFDPLSDSFIPRAFTLTQINLTHRNWTAVGVPDFSITPIVDPRGLIMPFFDSWSLDAWIVVPLGHTLFPSRLPAVRQQLLTSGNLTVETLAEFEGMKLITRARVIMRDGKPACEMEVEAAAPSSGWVVIALRPYNPEGISFVNSIATLPGRIGWRINDRDSVLFASLPDRMLFSNYKTGDVVHMIGSEAMEDKTNVECNVGMATAAALFRLEPGATSRVAVDIPLMEKGSGKTSAPLLPEAETNWERSLWGRCKMDVPDEKSRFLFEAAVRTIVLHSPEKVYAGPFTYKRFWFRDAAFIVNALLRVGLFERAEKILAWFLVQQKASGYFVSQEGEWDSNGQVLWVVRQYCLLTGKKLSPEWVKAVERAARWIIKKRLSPTPSSPHAGLLPAGFSAEHLGPNDYFYWDNFWSVSGLRAAAELMAESETPQDSADFEREANSLLVCIETSLASAAIATGRMAMPASPYRRLDSGAVGSLAAGYPLELWDARDARLMDTVEYLAEESLIEGGFFHDIIHSGINPYLTLHIAQVLLRANDARFSKLMNAIGSLASPTGQWPEAIHVRTKTGCMGDGQHVWAAAEWVLMQRNCFVREERDKNMLVLCSGVPHSWMTSENGCSFGPAPTCFGPVHIFIRPKPGMVSVTWEGKWFTRAPKIEIRFPGMPVYYPGQDQNSIEIPEGGPGP